MGHVAGLGPEYRKYLRRLEAGPVALPEPRSGRNHGARLGLGRLFQALAARACFVNSVNKTRACSECLEKPPKTQPSSVVPPAPWFRPPRGSGAALQECRFPLSVERREMGHVAGLGPEYRKYLRRLEAGPVALPEPADSQAQRGLQEILEILLSPEEAALAARLPHRPKTLDALAARTGIPPKQLEEKLDRLADRGIVLDLVSRRSGDKKYLLAPPVVGFFEFSMMRIRDSIPKKRMAEALSSYMFGDPAFAREVFEDVTPIGRALVHEGAIDDGAPGGDASAGCAPGASAPAAAPAVDGYPEVLEWERLSAAVENAQRFSLTNCYCRHKAQHLGTACDVPLETCISFDGSADFLLRHDFAWEIERAEALEVFQMCREQGLVQIADNVQQRPGYVCNCCGCCCAQLQAVRRYDIPAVIPSGFFAGSELSECTGCSRCARSCPVGAISMVPDPGASAGEGEAPARRRRTSLVPQVDFSRTGYFARSQRCPLWIACWRRIRSSLDSLERWWSWGVDNRDNSYQGVYPCGWFLTRCWIPARRDSEESRAIALFPWVSSRGLQGSPRGSLRRDPRGDPRGRLRGDSSFGQT